MSKNVAASVRQRLLNRSREQARPFNELLQYYGMERFLYRLSQSPHCERFILKGALMLRVWQSPESRPTLDIDLLGRTNNQPEPLLNQIREILATQVEDDGLTWDQDSLTAEPITQDANYQGLRTCFRAYLGTARIPMQLDIGFGDIVHPAPNRETFPTLLEYPAPEVLCYSRESAIAEKFQAMVHLGTLNSRAKDFYDIWLLSRQFDFKLLPLKTAVHKTFAQRNTSLPTSAEVFGPELVAAMAIHWKPFVRRINQPHVPMVFAEVASHLQTFLTPVLEPVRADDHAHWNAGGPWVAQASSGR